jgi:hypothetical protein
MWRMEFLRIPSRRRPIASDVDTTECLVLLFLRFVGNVLQIRTLGCHFLASGFGPVGVPAR